MDGAASGGDSTVSTILTTNVTAKCKHKDGPRCFTKSKATFHIPGCWGREMRSLHSYIIYGVNTENSDTKENKIVEKQAFHSSGKGNENITITSAGHSTETDVHQERYYGCSNSHIIVPSKHQQRAVCVSVCVGSVCKS